MINITYNIQSSDNPEQVAAMLVLLAPYQVNVSRPSRVAVESVAPSDEEKALEEEYRVKFGKGFRLTNDDKRAVERGEVTRIELIRERLEGKVEQGEVESVIASQLPSSSDDDDSSY